MADKTPSATRSPAHVLASLIDGGADPGDILDLARMLGPLEHGVQGGRSLLRRAFEREGYRMEFTDAQLEELAGTAKGGRAKAWELANEPPLAIWVHESLRRRCEIKSMAHRACVAIEMAPKQALPGSKHHAGGDFALALLDRSRDDDMGLDPFLALAKALKADPLAMTCGQGEERHLAILNARSPSAFELILASGDPRADSGGAPLWSALRDRARRRSDEALSKAIEGWAAQHESGREDSRKLAEYFESLSTYRGEESLKKRKDWTEVVDPLGRTAMMALALGRSASIKAWWEIKKAHGACAKLDAQGRSLWHYFVAKGKEAPAGTAAFLDGKAPTALDRHGRGIVASLHFSPLSSSEHEWLFPAAELRRAAKAIPDAKLWLGCEDGADAAAFGHWLANERYLADSPRKPGFLPSVSRGVESLAQLTAWVDHASLRGLPPPVAGALAFNLAIAPAAHPNYPSQKELPADLIAKAIGALLDGGGHVELSAASQSLLEARGAPENVARIHAAFEAARQARDLRASVPDPSLEKAPSLRI